MQSTIKCSRDLSMGRKLSEVDPRAALPLDSLDQRPINFDEHGPGHWRIEPPSQMQFGADDLGDMENQCSEKPVHPMVSSFCSTSVPQATNSESFTPRSASTPRFAAPSTPFFHERARSRSEQKARARNGTGQDSARILNMADYVKHIDQVEDKNESPTPTRLSDPLPKIGVWNEVPQLQPYLLKPAGVSAWEAARTAQVIVSNQLTQLQPNWLQPLGISGDLANFDEHGPLHVRCVQTPVDSYRFTNHLRDIERQWSQKLVTHTGSSFCSTSLPQAASSQSLTPRSAQTPRFTAPSTQFYHDRASTNSVCVLLDRSGNCTPRGQSSSLFRSLSVPPPGVEEPPPPPGRKGRWWWVEDERVTVGSRSFPRSRSTSIRSRRDAQALLPRTVLGGSLNVTSLPL